MRYHPAAAALAALALVACNAAPPEPADNGAAPAATPAPRAAAPPPPASAVPMAADVALAHKDALVDFSYAWPGIAAAIPALDRRFRADAATRRGKAENGAREDRKARAGEDFPFHPHMSGTKWTVDGDAAGLLSLRGQTDSFTGGAHGITVWEYILWDRAANRDIAPIGLFRDPAAARRLIQSAFCPALDAERAKKRGGPVTPDPTGKDWMTSCPNVMDEVLVLSDPQDGHFTAIRVLLGPYDAGPYAEGTYEVRLPVTPALVALLKPERAGVLAPPR